MGTRPIGELLEVEMEREKGSVVSGAVNCRTHPDVQLLPVTLPDGAVTHERCRDCFPPAERASEQLQREQGTDPGVVAPVAQVDEPATAAGEPVEAPLSEAPREQRGKR